MNSRFRVIMILVFLAFYENIFTQSSMENDSQLMYLVMAHVDFETRDPDFRDLEYNKEYLKILFRFEKGTFYAVDTLNAAAELKMDILLNFPEEKLFYFSESAFHTYRTSEVLSVFDYQDSLTIRRFKAYPDTLGRYLKSIYLLNIGDTLVFNNFRKSSDVMEVYTDYGIDKFFERKPLAPDNFKNILMEGYPGMQRKIPSYFFYYYLWGNLDSLRIYKTNSETAKKEKDIRAFPSASVQIPNDLKNEKSDCFIILINNKRYCVGVQTGGGKLQVKDPKFSALIFEKVSNKWRKFTYKGVRSWVMNWEDWLYGTVVLEKNVGSLDSTYFYFKKSRYDSTFGEPKYFDYNYPGVLFLYHIPTGKYMEWKTRDPDSEIILINKGIIYYRVFDELKEVELDLNKKEVDWSSDRIIVKDKKIIPNVHWIFFAPKMKVKEIWVEKGAK